MAETHMGNLEKIRLDALLKAIVEQLESSDNAVPSVNSTILQRNAQNLEKHTNSALSSDIPTEMLEDLQDEDFTISNEVDVETSLAVEIFPSSIDLPNSDRNSDENSSAICSAPSGEIIHNSQTPINLDMNFMHFSDEVSDQPTTSNGGTDQDLLRRIEKLFNEELDLNFLMTLPESVRKDLAADIGKMIRNEPSPIESDSKDKNFFDKNTITKESLSGWIDEYDIPEEDDITFCTDYFCFLIEANEIKELFEKMNHIIRIMMEIRENSCTWHNVFRILYSRSQEHMIRVHHKKLFFHLDINCESCSSEPFVMD